MSRKSTRVLLPTPTRGALGGYKTSLAESTRHRYLRESVRKLGANTVIKDLTLRATMNKNTHPRAAKIMREDADYVRGLK